MGVLYLPYGFSLSGYAYATVSIIIWGIFNFMGLSRLWKSAGIVNGDFSLVGYKVYGKKIKILIDWLLFFTQVGFATCYIVYIWHAIL